MSIMIPENPSLENPPETPRPAPDPRQAARSAVASGPVYFDPLNLSRRPFLNSRPVVRVSLLLWLLGLLLLLVNVSLFWSYLSGSEDKRAEIVRGEAAIQKGEADVRALEGRLDDIPLNDLNAEITFLNGKIQDRTFSWNLLLERLAEVLPHDVRLTRLSPVIGERARSGTRGRSVRRSPSPSGQVELAISGMTRDDDELWRFVDNLEAHPAFANPNPIGDERVEEGGSLIRFEMSVQYIPGSQSPEVVVEELPLPPAAAAPAPAAPTVPGGRP